MSVSPPAEGEAALLEARRAAARELNEATREARDVLRELREFSAETRRFALLEAREELAKTLEAELLPMLAAVRERVDAAEHRIMSQFVAMAEALTTSIAPEEWSKDELHTVASHMVRLTRGLPAARDALLKANLRQFAVDLTVPSE